MSTFFTPAPASADFAYAIRDHATVVALAHRSGYSVGPNELPTGA